MHILITSISKKVPLIQQVRQAAGKLSSDVCIYGADLDEGCIGTHFVDRFWAMPSVDELSSELFVDYCLEQQIVAVIPTRDGELSFFARHRPELQQKGIHVMVSPAEVVRLCLDKLLFYRTLERMNQPVIMTAEQIESIANAHRYVVKERFGAGSGSLGLGLSSQQAIDHARHLSQPVFQPFIAGQEVSVDVYVSLAGETQGVVVRSRDRVVGGESQVTTIVRLPELEEQVARLAEDLGLYGHALFQIILDRIGEPHIVECNARFGGASGLSVAAGLDSFYWFLLESFGQRLEQFPFQRVQGELKLVRYPMDVVIKE